MKIGFRLHLRNKHQYCCHLFSSLHSSLPLLIFISLYLPISAGLSCLPLVFSLACLSVISSISATPTQRLSPSITPQRWFFFLNCVCVSETECQRKIEWDNVCLCFCVSSVLWVFYVYFETSVSEEEKNPQQNRDNHVKCGCPPEGRPYVTFISFIIYYKLTQVNKLINECFTLLQLSFFIYPTMVEWACSAGAPLHIYPATHIHTWELPSATTVSDCSPQSGSTGASGG